MLAKQKFQNKVFKLFYAGETHKLKQIVSILPFIKIAEMTPGLHSDQFSFVFPPFLNKAMTSYPTTNLSCNRNNAQKYVIFQLYQIRIGCY